MDKASLTQIINNRPNKNSLEIHSQRLTAANLEFIAKELQRDHSITELNLSGCTFIDGRDNANDAWVNTPSVKTFANMLATNKHLTKLDLSSCQIDGYYLKLLLKGIKRSKSIVDVDLSDNNFNQYQYFGLHWLDNTLAQLFKENTSIKHLKLNNFGWHGSLFDRKLFMDSLFSNPNLETLEMRNNWQDYNQHIKPDENFFLTIASEKTKNKNSIMTLQAFSDKLSPVYQTILDVCLVRSASIQNPTPDTLHEYIQAFNTLAKAMNEMMSLDNGEYPKVYKMIEDKCALIGNQLEQYFSERYPGAIKGLPTEPLEAHKEISHILATELLSETLRNFDYNKFVEIGDELSYPNMYDMLAHNIFVNITKPDNSRIALALSENDNQLQNACLRQLLYNHDPKLKLDNLNCKFYSEHEIKDGLRNVGKIYYGLKNNAFELHRDITSSYANQMSALAALLALPESISYLMEKGRQDIPGLITHLKSIFVTDTPNLKSHLKVYLDSEELLISKTKDFQNLLNKIERCDKDIKCPSKDVLSQLEHLQKTLDTRANTWWYLYNAGPLAILPDEMRIIGENKNFRSALGIDPENSVIIAGKDHAIVKPESVNNSVPDASYNKILDISESVKKRATDKEPLLKGADHIRKELLAGNLELEIRPTFATANSSPQEQIKEKYKLAMKAHREAEKEPIKPNKPAPSPKQ